jgi:hypothetical protein
VFFCVGDAEFVTCLAKLKQKGHWREFLTSAALQLAFHLMIVFSLGTARSINARDEEGGKGGSKGKSA